MKMIINYIINMIPYMLISVPIFIIIRLIIFYKKKKINIKREILLLIFYLFLVGLFSQAIIPKSSIDLSKNSINIIPLKIIYDTIAELKKGNIDYLIISLLGNIVMFIPIGYFIKILWNCNNKKTILLGFLISLFIETSQLFIGRETDIDDLLLNTFGVIIGIVLYKLIKKTKK
ncbi:MAG: VanZ family protein [Bacilli bacterium]|nr:VanZ family protein [Bacilli bacterium]